MGGVPSVFEDFCWSWGMMVQYNAEYLCRDGEYVHYDRPKISYHSAARNMMVERMRGDWLFMLDTDHKFDPDILGRLLHRMDQYKVQVVTGLYQLRSEPYAPVIYKRHPTDPDGNCQMAEWSVARSPLFVDSAGAGCLLIQKGVFQRIKSELGEQPFDQRGPQSEDHSFFRRCELLKIPVLCDPRIEANHLSVEPIDMSWFDKSEVNMIDYDSAAVQGTDGPTVGLS
jgi:hypothetical protein